jgi:hypothetical protein
LPGGQPWFWHRSPLYPAAQRHRPGAEQVPCSHPPGQTGSHAVTYQIFILFFTLCHNTKIKYKDYVNFENIHHSYEKAKAYLSGVAWAANRFAR